MTSYESMKQKLAPMGLYSLSSGSEVDCELKAYAMGLQPLFDELDMLEREAFIPTAETFGLRERERFIGKERDDLNTEERRERLICAEQCMGDDATLRGFEKFMRSCGLKKFEVVEYPTRARIEIFVNDLLPPGEKNLVVEKISREVPAHMNTIIHFNGYSQNVTV